MEEEVHKISYHLHAKNNDSRKRGRLARHPGMVASKGNNGDTTLDAVPGYSLLRPTAKTLKSQRALSAYSTSPLCSLHCPPVHPTLHARDLSVDVIDQIRLPISGLRHTPSEFSRVLLSRGKGSDAVLARKRAPGVHLADAAMFKALQSVLIHSGICLSPDRRKIISHRPSTTTRSSHCLRHPLCQPHSSCHTVSSALPL